ncbi:MAG: N-acetylmuramoyl-L-alanine amidase [Planctomycetes bacterium]|nr:N-acetylmuramoyl-L-alanine amidase [Planctomycetota bacterium]
MTRYRLPDPRPELRDKILDLVSASRERRRAWGPKLGMAAALLMPIVTLAAIFMTGEPRAAEHAPAQAQDTFVVVIDPGRGGRRLGAEGKDLVEKDVVLDVALRVRELLKAQGVDVHLTREIDLALDDDVERDLKARAHVANDRSADLFVSLHLDHSGDAQSTGFLALIPRGADIVRASESGRAAALLRRNLSVLMPGEDHGSKEQEVIVLKHVRCPAVLLEMATLSSGDTEARGSDPQQVSEAITGAVLEYAGSQSASISAYLKTKGDGLERVRRIVMLAKEGSGYRGRCIIQDPQEIARIWEVMGQSWPTGTACNCLLGEVEFYTLDSEDRPAASLAIHGDQGSSLGDAGWFECLGLRRLVDGYLAAACERGKFEDASELVDFRNARGGIRFRHPREWELREEGDVQLSPPAATRITFKISETLVPDIEGLEALRSMLEHTREKSCVRAVLVDGRPAFEVDQYKPGEPTHLLGRIVVVKGRRYNIWMEQEEQITSAGRELFKAFVATVRIPRD